MEGSQRGAGRVGGFQRGCVQGRVPARLRLVDRVGCPRGRVL